MRKLHLVLFFIQIFLIPQIGQTNPLKHFWYRCEALLNGDVAYLKALPLAMAPLQIASKRLIIKPLETAAEIQSMREVEDDMRRILRESGNLGTYQNIEEVFLPTVSLYRRRELGIRSEYVILHRLTRQVVGFIGTLWTPADRTVRYGGGILPSFQRQHYGREARIALMKHYKQWGVERFETLIHNTNKPSIALSRSLGFHPMEYLSYFHGDQLVDATVYVLPSTRIPEE